MPKRCNPYLEDVVQQSKKHIGLKQFNNNRDKLKIVYEKTLELLFRGANKIRNGDLIQNVDTKPIERKDCLKQLFIGKDGTLLHSGTMANDRNCMHRCVCSNLTSDCCAYCDIALCTPCQHQCTICKLLYCSKCSLTVGEGNEICVSCYS